MENLLPKATRFQGDIKIGDVTLRCYVLNDLVDDKPVRLVTGRAVTSALEVRGRNQGMARFINSKMLQGYIPPDVENAIRDPVKFVIASGIRPSHGYEARIIPELCFAIMDAYNTGKQNGMRTPTDRTFQQARILAKAFSVVGIEALVDEATGYQEVRDKQALQKILDRYVAKEWRAWTKTFPDAFYKELFRLKGWQWKGMSVRRPQVIGHLTNDLVYKRLAPGVLEELKRNVPRNDQGKPKKKLHSGLTEDLGVVKLEQHLTGVVALMRAFTSWQPFYRAIDRSLPRWDKSPPLDFGDED